MIAYVRAELDPEIAADPLIGQVGWSWLTEALDARTVGYRQVSGTVTRVVTEGFGAKEGPAGGRPSSSCGLSWSPATPAAGTGRDQGPPDLDGHMAAWCDALCAACRPAAAARRGQRAAAAALPAAAMTGAADGVEDTHEDSAGGSPVTPPEPGTRSGGRAGG